MTLFLGLFQVIVPLLLVGTLALARTTSRLLWATQALAFGMVIAFMWAGARWDISSTYLRDLFPVLWLGAAIIGFRRVRRPGKTLPAWQMIAGVAINLLVGVLMSGFLWFSFRGYVVPNGAVDLASPLRDGSYIVLHGGASPFTNAHFRIRPQSYALDILGLNGLGMRTDVFGDRGNLDSYAIFGATIYSPCDGNVAVAVDEFEDLTPPQTDTDHLAGNHVLIECNGVEILLAHLRRGSVQVRVGETVSTQTVLGAVGNSGNTSEPHLHVHAESDGTPGVILDGRSVPITIDGRYLVRGDILKNR